MLSHVVRRCKVAVFRLRLFVYLIIFLGINDRFAYSAELKPISLIVPNEKGTFSRAFFGMHVHNSGNSRNWPNIPIGSIRLWDADVTWKSLEPEKGTWNFKKLDEYVEWAQSHEVEVLLVLGVPPLWASARPNEIGAYGPGSAAEPYNIEEWRNYVRTVAHRYRGRIAGYQVWNEANLPEFYTGSIEALVKLVSVANEEVGMVDPKAIVVAPSGQGLDGRELWISRLAKLDIGRLVDVVSYHLYHSPRFPESIISPVLNMKKLNASAGLAAMPIWNTESGYWMPNKLVKWTTYEQKNEVSLDVAAQYLPRDMLLSRALGFERFYWYAWDNTKMGFRDPVTKTNRPLALVLSQFFNALKDTSLRRCDRNTLGLWSCQLTGANGLKLVALWIDPSAEQQQQNISPPFRGKWMQLDGVSKWKTTSDYLKINSTVTIVSE